jgi:hypothetical protein
LSFGLRISFGHLINRERTLHDVYADARRIEGWEDNEGENCLYGINRRTHNVYYVRIGKSPIIGAAC